MLCQIESQSNFSAHDADHVVCHLDCRAHALLVHMHYMSHAGGQEEKDQAEEEPTVHGPTHLL